MLSKKSIDLLNEFADLIDGAGDPCDFGCDLDTLEQQISRARELYPDKPVRAVSDWVWADIRANPELRLILEQRGLQPAFLYSGNLLYCDQGTCMPGTALRTSMLKSFSSPCFFCTKNTCYVLVGTGARTSVDKDVFISMVF